MKKIISLLLVIAMIFSMATVFTGCGDGDSGCYVCGGTGYYQKKYCPVCH